MIKFYGYKKCSTCLKAKKLLDHSGKIYKNIEITENPPSLSELKKLIKRGAELKHLLNTSGVQYRELGMKDKIQTYAQDDILRLLSQNGKLVKRPIVISAEKHTIGFKEDIFRQNWL